MKIFYLSFCKILISEGSDPAKEIVGNVMSMDQVVVVADNTDLADNFYPNA